MAMEACKILTGFDRQSFQVGIDTVIVNYNSGDYLSECIEKALPQVDRVVVIDNGSSDNSLNELEKSFSDDDEISIVRNQANLGFSTACNIGIQHAADKPYILFLNPDCLLESNVIGELTRHIESDPEVGMVGGLLINPDGSEQPGGRRSIPTPWRSFVRAFGLTRFADRWPRLFADFCLHNQALPDCPVEVEAISGACMLVRREALENVGIWDEGYFLHCEDLDWCMRFRQKGWKIMFVPSAKMVHIQGVSGKNRKLFVEWHKHKGMMRFYKKFFRHQYPGVLMWLVTGGVWMHFGLIATAHIRLKLLRRVGLTRE